jgi:hypothetical protein
MARKVSLRIHYDRRSGLAVLLTLALLSALLPVYLARGQKEADASNPETVLLSSRYRALAVSTGVRHYYLTQDPAADATHALTACTAGYHMASLWEILDPSQLKYNRNLGAARDDSGQGPPAFFGGLVRTGYSSNTSITPGWGNCSAWSSNDSSHYGTYAQLPSNWTAAKHVHVWQVGVTSCSTSTHVWCVEDYVIYLPLIFKT